MSEKHCITCDENGHTYLECKKAPFVNILADAFGLPGLLPKPVEYDKTTRQLRERAKAAAPPRTQEEE